MNLIKKGVIATTLAATALVSTTPAMARDYHRDNDNTAAVAIGAGIIGVALGAIIASSGNHNDRYDRYDSRYYQRDGWYYNDGYYYNRSGQRYSRNDWQRRYGNDRNYRNDRDYRNNRDYRDESRRGYENGQDRDYYQRRGY